MMDIPDEILAEIINGIIEPDPDHIYNVGDQTPVELFVQINSRLYNVNNQNPICAVSMVNRHFRRICLPVLFRHMYLAPYRDHQDEETEDQSETERFCNMLGRNAHLAHFVRHILLDLSWYSIRRDGYYRLVLNILARFPNLELMELMGDATCYDQVTIIEAVNRYPCPSLRIVYRDFRALEELAKYPPPPMSLSRLIFSSGLGYRLESLRHRGLGVLSLFFPLADRYTETYPALEEIWGAETIPSGILSDFLKRHPKLKKVMGLIVTNWVSQIPWGDELQATLLVPRDVDDFLTIVRVQNEWHFLNVALQFKVSSALDIVDVMSKLMLPHARKLILDFEVGAVTGEDLNTLPIDKFVPKNCPQLYNFEIIFRCISKRQHSTQSTENSDAKDSALQSRDMSKFFSNIVTILNQPLKRLKITLFPADVSIQQVVIAEDLVHGG
ncbi:hypothetical protein VKT23_014223 [Stygiomarasmius scandens]|uniref:F-box domain-containing protein n=1 Tax=Marasmiellus scandens TaxID=2682957 RepID=A0ABR1J0V0_9AGAR